MAEEKKSTPKTTGKKGAAPKKASNVAGQNGKGDAPRNCFSDAYRGNFDAIDWSK